MGHRTTQRILKCAICQRIPEDGEPMWEMNSDHWCEQCCDDIENETMLQVDEALGEGK